MQEIKFSNQAVELTDVLQGHSFGFRGFFRGDGMISICSNDGAILSWSSEEIYMKLYNRKVMENLNLYSAKLEAYNNASKKKPKKATQNSNQKLKAKEKGMVPLVSEVTEEKSREPLEKNLTDQDEMVESKPTKRPPASKNKKSKN